MGFLDFLKKKSAPADLQRAKKADTNTFGDSFDRLTESGELPFGWVYHNNDFTSKIGGEYTHFLNTWLEARDKSPKELYAALKSFVIYLEDAEKLCKSKGECFEWWFYNDLASKEYIESRKKELRDLINNLDYLQEIHEKLTNLKPAVIILLKKNDGILQSEFIKLFDAPFQSTVSNMLYEMSISGEVERTKSGRSYILHYKGKNTERW